MKLPQSKIWKPPLNDFNGVKEKDQVGFDESLVDIQSSGLVTWPIDAVLSVHCEIDITYYPFDYQTCSLVFNMKMSNTDDIDIVPGINGGPPLTTNSWQSDGTWELLGATCDYISAMVDDKVCPNVLKLCISKCCIKCMEAIDT